MIVRSKLANVSTAAGEALRARLTGRTPLLSVVLALASTCIPYAALVPEHRGTGFAALAAVVLTLVWGTSDIASGVFLRSFHRGAPQGNALALTFDDGPDPEWTPRVLDLLRAAGEKATFFVLGARMAAHPGLVAQIVAEGHELGLHTWDHPWSYPFRSPKRIADDLARSRAVFGAQGLPPPRWFRPPNGLLTPSIAQEVVRAGLLVAGWCVRARDGVAVAPTVVVARVLPGLRAGAVVLMHDARSPHGGDRAPAGPLALPWILAALRTRGLRSVTLSTLAACSS